MDIPSLRHKDTPHASGMAGCPTGPSIALKDHYRVSSTGLLNVNIRQLKTPHHDWSALIDRGANGCIAGRDMKVIETTMRTIDLSGIDDHTVRNLAIVTAGAIVRTNLGEIIVILHQAADMTSDSRTILSAGQLESFGCTIHDKSPVVATGEPHIRTSDGYIIPIRFQKGLPFIKLRRFDADDWDKLPHIHLTSPVEWDPSTLDTNIPDDWYTSQPKHNDVLRDGTLTELGALKDDLEADDTEDHSDRIRQAVDRGSIRAYLSSLIPDELGDGYILCEGEGTTHTVDYIPDIHDPYFAPAQSRSSYVSTRSGRQVSTPTSTQAQNSPSTVLVSPNDTPTVPLLSSTLPWTAYLLLCSFPPTTSAWGVMTTL
jgi:hypothetical protein